MDNLPLLLLWSVLKSVSQIFEKRNSVLFDCSFCHVKNNRQGNVVLFANSLWKNDATVQKRTVKPKKAKRRKKKEKSRELYSTHFNTQQTHTHTQGRSRDKEERLKDFVSVKRRRSLRRSAFIHILFSKRDCCTLCHQKHIKIIIRAHFWKSKGERDEQHCERDDDDRQ